MHNIEKITPASGNPKQAKETPKTEVKKKQDKPFCSVLNEVMLNSLLDKAYPTARTYEKEGKG